MTPKEKAKEIFDKMYGKTPVRDEESIIELDRDRDTAIQCALVAVDEMLQLGLLVGSDLSDIFYIYWQEVKQEIETL
jgi:predicted proteasome-type protease